MHILIATIKLQTDASNATPDLLMSRIRELANDLGWRVTFEGKSAACIEEKKDDSTN